MSNVSKRKKEGSRAKIKSMGDHREFLKRITKTLYYGQLPTLACLSLPVTEISCEAWSEAQRGRSLRRLHADAAAHIARAACVSPCALVLAVLYLERLKRCNPDYLAAAAPVDLFLVSLMVSNKFLQDDGEDDEVVCSEWAASGSIELEQLKKLEIEFLNAIDWNVYVSEKSFESGLSWLERQVALKQAQLRGFFTYTDLVATYDGALLAELLRALSSACLALTSLMTFLTSTLVLSHVCLPTLQYIALRGTVSTAIDTNIITDFQTETYVPNSTVDPVADILAKEVAFDDLRCCTDWMKYRASTETERNWYDGIVDYDWTFETWWSKTSVLNWLYQSSLINPTQRWLEKMDEYSDFFRAESAEVRCGEYPAASDRRQCVRQWLNLSKLGVLVASVSDR